MHPSAGPGRLARLQQVFTLGALALAMVWAAWQFAAGRPFWAVLGLALITLGHSLVLAFELVLLQATHGADPTPRADKRALLRAWWGEVLAAPVVFCWRQPFCSQRWPDQLPSKANGRRGVVFIHGFVCNRGLWNPWLKRLTAQGTPFVAVNLEPVFGSIDDTLGLVENAVRRVEAATGLAPVLVGHSMGGLVLRRWYAEHGGNTRMHHAITIGTPHQGTWLARWGHSSNAQQMRLSSPWLDTLRQREPADTARRFTCFYSHCDNVVFPPQMATLPGADNRHLHGLAHVHMADAPQPWAELQHWLGQSSS